MKKRKYLSKSGIRNEILLKEAVLALEASLAAEAALKASLVFEGLLRVYQQLDERK